MFTVNLWTVKQKIRELEEMKERNQNPRLTRQYENSIVTYRAIQKMLEEKD